MLDTARTARDFMFGLVSAGRTEAEVEGIRLSLNHPAVSPRMRYVLSRGYEAGDARLARRALSASDAVIEAGSSIGFMALYCLKVIGVRQYCMVEANRNLASLVRENFELNGQDLSAVHNFNVAITDADKPVEFSVNKNFWSSSVLHRKNSVRRESIQGRSLPSLVTELPFRPNVLIMDIEGGEAAIPPDHFAPFEKVLIEVHPTLVGEDTIAGLLDSLREAGFRQRDREGASYFLERQSAQPA